jgi:Zn-dependent peptidase ImmA (M78 family)
MRQLDELPHLEESLGLTPTAGDDARLDWLPMDSDAAQAAERLLGDLDAGSVPVDPVRIARALGIQVVDAPLDDGISGALMKERDRDPRIVLNSRDSANRRRFTCAHELGHFVKRNDEPDEYEYIDFRDGRSSTGTDHEERYANTFAASLLMPERDVRRLDGLCLGEVEMALRFGVSREAMHYRLKNLQLL